VLVLVLVHILLTTANHWYGHWCDFNWCGFAVSAKTRPDQTRPDQTRSRVGLTVSFGILQSALSLLLSCCCCCWWWWLLLLLLLLLEVLENSFICWTIWWPVQVFTIWSKEVHKILRPTYNKHKGSIVPPTHNKQKNQPSSPPSPPPKVFSLGLNPY